MGDLPDFLGIDSEVVVGNDVAKTLVFCPRDTWFRRFKLFQKLCDRFSDIYKVHQDCVEGFFIFVEFIRIGKPHYELADFATGF